MKSNNKIYIFVIIDIILVITIILILNTKILPKDTNETINNTNQITSYNGLFEIVVPSNWKLPEQRGKLNAAADIELIDNENLYYCIVLMENKQDLKINFNEYANISFNLIEETYNTKIEKNKIVTINNNSYSILYTALNAKSGENHIYMYAYILETQNYFGKCLIWSSVENNTSTDDTLNNMIKSIKEI